MEIIKTLLSIYCGVLALNIVFSLQLALTYRTRVYMAMLGLWSSTLVNFLLQLFITDFSYFQVLAFATYIFTAYCICYILTKTSGAPEFQLRFNKYWILVAVALSVSLANAYLFDAFVWVALPVAVAVAAPQLIYSTLKLTRFRSAGSHFGNTFAVITFINGVHFLDYPWLRPIPEMALFGFSFVIATSMILAALLPAMLTKYHADRLTKQLNQEIENKKKVQRELAAALIRARHLTKVKSEFLANMSHEIRTPINGIVGYNGLMSETSLTAMQSDYCKGIKKSSDRLNKIIDSVLKLANLESGAIHVHSMKFCLPDFVSQIQDHYQTVLEQECRVVCEQLTPLPEFIISDVSKLEQIIFNLANNAIKFSQSELIQVRFSFHPKNERQLMIEVIDTGVGISSDKIDSLLQQFQDYDDTQDGIGHGLSITYQMVEILHGRISIESEVHEGTSFMIEVPVEMSEEEEDGPVDLDGTSEKEKRPTLTALSQNNQGKMVLLVEDDKVNQAILSRIIKSMGLTVHLAENKREALSLYQNHQYDLIFTDIQLPDGNGLELMEAVRASGCKLPIIACSSFSFEEDVRAAMSSGATDYLKKPVSPNDVKGAIVQCLETAVELEVQ